MAGVAVCVVTAVGVITLQTQVILAYATIMNTDSMAKAATAVLINC